jgi:peptide/nickel transport system permease protein
VSASVAGTIADAPPAASVARSQGRWRLFRRGLRNRKALIGGVIVGLVVFCGVFADLISPYDPVKQELVNKLQPPLFFGGTLAHPLGTDSLGRDILSRLIFGARVSLIVGVVSVLFQATIGVILGLIAGYYGGWIDAVIMRFADIQLALPFLILALAVIAVLGTGLQNIIIALGLTGWVLYGRTVRAEVLAVREREYVQAARLTGASDRRIVIRHILPNDAVSLIVLGTLQVARMIISEASLSYLGLGIPPPTASWGGMVAEGRNVISLAWWVATLPGLATLFSVIGINLLGDFLRDELDPYMRNR